MNFKALLSKYFRSWWFAPLVALVALLVFAAAGLAFPLVPKPIPEVLFFVFGASVLGMVAVAISNFVHKRWWRGFAQLGMALLAGGGFFFVAMAIVFAAFFGPSEDHFADNLVIPEGIDIADTKAADGFTIVPEGKDVASNPDALQSNLKGALNQGGSSDPTVSASVDALIALRGQHPDLLQRYLAANPAWRVFTQDGNRYATRRWKIGGQWRYTLHGYYTGHDFNPWGSRQDFQYRLTLGFSGEPWYSRRSGDTQMTPGQIQPLSLSTGNQMHESRLVIDVGRDLVVEIFEQSGAKERRLTKESLRQLEIELAPLAATPKWGTIRQLLPAGSIRHGQPTLELRESFQPGIYDAWVWANPCEPGMIYLKAFEVTEGAALSVSRLKEYSNEWIGWSDDPDELFLSNTHLTIYEGDWGKPYAARFEVWFVPDSGGPKRKLLEKVFRIEGWQH
jgi:hypothetical protein